MIEEFTGRYEAAASCSRYPADPAVRCLFDRCISSGHR